MANPFNFPVFKAFTTSGTLAPLSLGNLYTFEAGTSTPQAVYQDEALTTPHTNPVTLDANGEAIIYLGPNAYKMRLEDSTGSVQPGWPIDGLQNDTDTLRADLAASSGSSLVGFIQSGVGAVPLTVEDALRENASAKHFGAVGDGIHDDSQAVRDALFECDTVFLPDGDYLIRSSIVMTAGKSLIGHKGGVRLLGGADNLIIIDTDQSGATNNKITVSGISLENAGAYTGIVGIRLTKASFFSGSHIYSRGISYVLKGYEASGFSHINDLVMYQGDNGIYLYKCSNFVITNSTLSSVYTANAYIGVEIDSHCDGVELSSVNIEGSKYGLKTSNSDGGFNYPLSTILTNVQAGANGSSANGIGFWIEHGSGVQLNNCIGLSAAGNGILIQTHNGVTLTGTNCVNNGFYGLVVGSSNVQINGGIFGQNSKAASNTYSGISVNSNSDNVSISGSTCGAIGDYTNLQKHGIEISSGCDNLTISDITYGANVTSDILTLSLPNTHFKTSNAFIVTGNKNIVNTIIETSIIPSGTGFLTLPADWFKVGRTVTLKLSGYINNTGTPTLRFRWMGNAVAWIDTTAITMDAITGTRFIDIELSATCRSVGAAGTLACVTKIIYGTGASGISQHSIIPSFPTVDTTTANTIDLLATWGTASASNELGINHGFIGLSLSS